MKWNHLPMPGGIYNQNPALIDKFYYIMQEKDKFEELESKKKAPKVPNSKPR